MGIPWQSRGWDSVLSLLGGMGSIPVQGTRILQTAWYGQQKKKKISKWQQMKASVDSKMQPGSLAWTRH